MLLSKTQFIAKQLPEYNADDIYDVLLGNITKPTDFVDEVMAAADFYDSLLEKGINRDNS